MPLLTELLSCYALTCVTLKLFHRALAGLKAGDEILQINNRAAGTLNSSMLKDFLSQPSLGLLVRTYPEPEGGLELLENPPHRVDGPVDLGESPLAFLTSNQGMLCPGLRFTRPCLGRCTTLCPPQGLPLQAWEDISK